MHRESRFVPKRPYEGFLLLEPDDSCETPDFYSVKLTELSRAGIQFRSSRPIPAHKSFSLTFITDTGSLEIIVTGDIRWTKQDDAGTLIGCQLSSPLPQSVLRNAVGEACSAEPQTTRHINTEEISGFLDLKGVHIPAELKNYSEGGFCLETRHVFEPATKLCYVVENPPMRILGNVEWRITNARGGYTLGCSYDDNQAPALLALAQEHAVPCVTGTPAHGSMPGG